MDAEDVVIRNVTYDLFVSLGRAPTMEHVAAETGRTPDDVAASWGRLHDAHALVLDASRRHIRMANPFSANPTAHRVQAAGRWWFANCAWDAFGICAALHADGLIETVCPDCAEPLTIRVVGQEPQPATALFHCLRPARLWWDDIAFT